MCAVTRRHSSSPVPWFALSTRPDHFAATSAPIAIGPVSVMMGASYGKQIAPMCQLSLKGLVPSTTCQLCLQNS